MTTNRDKVSSWVVIGIVVAGAAIVFCLCGGQNVTVCDGKITTVQRGQSCPEK